ncbi:MAG: DUF1559 domain-containing protein [Thermoguttaceae bacterium]
MLFAILNRSQFVLIALLLTAIASFSLVTSSGCSGKKAANNKMNSEDQEASVPFPNADFFEKLGSDNGLETHWFFSDPVFVVSGQPARLFSSPIGKGNEAMIAEILGRTLSFPFNLEKLERFVIADAEPRSVQISAPLAAPLAPESSDSNVEKNNESQNESAQNNGDKNVDNTPKNVLIRRRTIQLTFLEPIQKADFLAPLLPVEPEKREEMLKSIIRTSGASEYYDLTPPNFSIPSQSIVIFPNDRTVILAEGLRSDIESMFSDKSAKSGAIERLKRIDLAANDLVLVVSLEGNRVNPNLFGQILLDNGVSPQFISAFVKNLKAMTAMVNFSAAESKPILQLKYESLSDQGATELDEVVKGLLVLGQTTLLSMSDEVKQAFPIPVDFAISALKSTSLQLSGNHFDFSFNKFADFDKIVSEGLAKQKKAMAEMQIAMQEMQFQQQRMEQIRVLAGAMLQYYQQNEKFPADIRAEDGTPLLSWRVAMLPFFGADELYKKFKLDESWDGETNKLLLESMPNIFRPFSKEVKIPNTIIRFFNSPGTPFSNPELKPLDIKFPNTTLMLVSVSPNYAVEWTKPDSLAFDPDKMEEMFGPEFLGVTFAGQIAAARILPDSNPESATQKEDLKMLVLGLQPKIAPDGTTPEVPAPAETSPESAVPNTAAPVVAPVSPAPTPEAAVPNTAAPVAAPVSPDAN